MSEAGSTFVVLDTETTGISAASARVIEYGAVRLDDRKIVDRFSTFVNPGCSVPTRITRLTGIRTADLQGAPGPAAALSQLRSFVGKSPLVMHNASFDRAFLDAEAARAEMAPIGEADICSMRLARRILPGLRSKGLKSLAAHFGIQNPRAHRALADAETTARVFVRLLERMDVHGLPITAESLQSRQRRTYQSAGVLEPHIASIRQRVLPNAPAGPGVYYLESGGGQVLYVGKAKTLKSRLRSHFSAVEAKPGRLQDLMHLVRSVRWTSTQTELEALVLESREIKRLRPRFNRAQLRYRRRPYVRSVRQEGTTVVSFTSFIRSDDAGYLGPLPDRHFAARVADLLELVTGTRVKRGSLQDRDPDWAAWDLPQIELESILRGDVSPLESWAAEGMAKASADFRFEDAAALRDFLSFLADLPRYLGPVFTGWSVAWHPDRSEWNVIRAGMLAGSLKVHSPESQTLMQMLDSPVQEESRTEVEADETHVINQWAYRNRKKLIRWEALPDESAAAFAERVLASLEQTQASR